MTNLKDLTNDELIQKYLFTFASTGASKPSILKTEERKELVAEMQKRDMEIPTFSDGMTEGIKEIVKSSLENGNGVILIDGKSVDLSKHRVLIGKTAEGLSLPIDDKNQTKQ